MSDTNHALEARNITKRFGRVQALHGISLTLKPGEMLGILGDNGAGKSTLMKILSGYHAPTTGELLVKGEQVEFTSVDHARSFGIECVYQDLALVNTLSVYHNMFLNREVRHGASPFLNHKEMRERAAAALEDIGVNVPSVDEEVGMLSGGQRQAIAIARAVSSNARVLLLDEPLAAMGAREAGMIIALIERLKARGDVSLIMIAHNYAQTLDVADKVMMVQRGTCTFEGRSADTSVLELLDIVKREYRAAAQ
ncbi:ATP-binding cassette domain-containing protein [Acidocella aminolytica]|jgi:ABC-type sugar transport system ATPase subunit|uniref:ABC transporter n=1 Tax=Acidocella aminolytica 101 = DSM 11237 TaxID=1120923 RepID=A0A0D6PD90_9PROT|nr:ATP-binding cassette domain-containing protein [Acidocella aminolytica]GAN79163.1 ABC transporter [Acidocella aminolytica 101 = DSM 11237]GBQ43638.1 putative ABC transporter ATP-binding protein [Acidocella aminolytica 101 = DSM 11237]SHE67160.1 monosaccharide ABC transporter ATP-binding protein, CUT2 family [Acidocella aminolytica 101 = DSM 11237]